MRPPDPEVRPASRAFFPVGAGGVLVRLLVPVGVALLAQRGLGTSRPVCSSLGVVLYLIALAGIAWGVLKGEWRLVGGRSSDPGEADPDEMWQKVRPVGFVLALLLSLAAFLMFGGGRFTRANLVVWLLALAAFLVRFLAAGGASLSLVGAFACSCETHPDGWTYDFILEPAGAGGIRVGGFLSLLLAGPSPGGDVQRPRREIAGC